MNKMKSIVMFLLVILAGMALAPAEAKDINRIRAPKKFDYSTQRTVPVNIQAALPGPGPAAVSLLAYYPDAPRLLQTGLTDAAGLYTGDLTVPAAVRTIIVSVRYEGHVKESKVAAKKRISKRIRF